MWCRQKLHPLRIFIILQAACWERSAAANDDNDSAAKRSDLCSALQELVLIVSVKSVRIYLALSTHFVHLWSAKPLPATARFNLSSDFTSTSLCWQTTGTQSGGEEGESTHSKHREGGCRGSWAALTGTDITAGVSYMREICIRSKKGLSVDVFGLLYSFVSTINLYISGFSDVLKEKSF